MRRCSWAPAAILRRWCCCYCAPGTASAPWRNTRRAIRKRSPRSLRRTASESTSKATATANRPSTACTWRSWSRRPTRKDGAISEPPAPLPRRLYLRRGQVADDQVLLHLVDHDLIRLARLAAIELYRFVDVLVLLFRQLVVGHHFDRVLVLLGVDALQLQRDVADALR